MRCTARFLIAVALLAAASTVEGASLVTTTTSPNAIPSASKYVTHWASGHYWIAVRDGSASRLLLHSSPDGASWTSQGAIFAGFYPADYNHAVRYVGDTIVAFGYRFSDDTFYYREGTLEPAGTVTWNAPEVSTGVVSTTDLRLNAAIINGKPAMWRAGPANADSGWLTLGDQLDAPVNWSHHPAPALSSTTPGGSSAGAVLPLGGADPNDLIILRSTTADPYSAGSHRLVSLKFDASASAFDPSWYNVSMLGGGLAEDTTTEVRDRTDGSAHMRFAAVRDAYGAIHAIYVNRDRKAVHYRKDPGMNDAWARLSTDITGAASTSKVGLSAAENGKLLLYYEKADDRIWTRRFDGAAWGPETLLFDSGGTDINHSLGPMELIAECASGLTFSEGVSSPVNILFAPGGGGCEVEAFAATSTSAQNRLQWVNPTGPYDHTRILARDDGVFPTDPNDLISARLVRDDFGTAGAKAAWDDTGLVNGTKYSHTAFVHDGTGYSAGISVRARPFDNSGNVKWAYSTSATAMAPPGLRFSGGAAFVYAVSNDSFLHAMVGGASGGTWPASWKPHEIGAPAQARPPVVPFQVGSAGSGAALLGSQDGKVYAIDAATGDHEWSRWIAPVVQASPAGNFTAFDPAAHDLVFAGTRDGVGRNSLYALNVVDGAYVWRFFNGAAQGGDDLEIGVINGSASVDYTNRHVYFTSNQRVLQSQDTVWCVDFDSGSPTIVWKRNLGDINASPVLWNGVLYIGTKGSVVYALDAATGATNWSRLLSDGDIKSFVFPQFGTNNVIVSTDTQVWSIADNGGSSALNPGWPVTSADVPSPSTPLYVPGSSEVVVGSSDGKLHQLNVATPLPSKNVPLGDGLAAVGIPTMDLLNSMIYVGTVEGVIYGVSFPLP